MTEQRPARPSIPWWSPQPVSIAAGLYAGAVCYGFQTFDRELGKQPCAEFGIPLVYRWVPRVGFSNAPRFEPAALAVDILACAIVVFVCAASVQVFVSLIFGRRRLTLRSLMILVALAALPMGLTATLGPEALVLLSPAFFVATVLVFGSPFALGLFGAVMALDAAAGYLSQDRRRPADRGDSPS